MNLKHLKCMQNSSRELSILDSNSSTSTRLSSVASRDDVDLL